MATIMISILIAVLAAAVIIHMVKQKKSGRSSWAITNSSDTPADTEWRSVAGSQTGITESMTINAKGTYYAWVKDGTNVVGGDKYKIAIYKIDFDGNGGTGTMRVQ